MARREDKGRMGSFARGSELWMHQARLFVVAIGTVVLLSVLVGLAVTSGYFWHATTAAEKYALERNVLARTRDVLGMTAGKMELHIEGQLRLLEVEQVARLTQALAEEGWRKLRNGGLFGVLSAAGFVFLVSLYWWGYGRAKMQDRQLRGAQLVAGPELAMLVRQRKEASPYEIAGVPMRLKSETLHTLLAGAQGTGKSQQFFALMKQVRAQGKRMIVYDPTGEFTQAFYRAGKDILMNPLDARSPNWNVWQEIAKDFHYDNIANGLIPDPAGSDPFWAHAGRMLLKDVIVVLGKKGKRTNRELYHAIAKTNLEDLHKLLQGMAGASYVDPTTERTGMSLGVQDFSQLYEIYGHNLAKTIISGCQTKLLLRFTDGAAAKLLSDLMGQAVIL